MATRSGARRRGNTRVQQHLSRLSLTSALHSHLRLLLVSYPSPPRYDPGPAPISHFPYASCDNFMDHSPLRLGPPNKGSAVAWGPEGLTYCWSVSHVKGTQCDPPKGGQACCQQDLSAIYFEISQSRGFVIGRAVLNGPGRRVLAMLR